eukprot:TRINITY_DN12280_c0_g1_i1.p1 TRINITY_DN12280_c0_g1~~TRINITY_DN12280_c0_g1_i1.p1  ORF type:complete len:467 (-),score=46.25 TRINITY_DN12280_c0_g1_i1:17-1417(-)
MVSCNTNSSSGWTHSSPAAMKVVPDAQSSAMKRFSVQYSKSSSPILEFGSRRRMPDTEVAQRGRTQTLQGALLSGRGRAATKWTKVACPSRVVRRLLTEGCLMAGTYSCPQGGGVTCIHTAQRQESQVMWLGTSQGYIFAWQFDKTAIVQSTQVHVNLPISSIAVVHFHSAPSNQQPPSIVPGVSASPSPTSPPSSPAPSRTMALAPKNRLVVAAHGSRIVKIEEEGPGDSWNSIRAKASVNCVLVVERERKIAHGLTGGAVKSQGTSTQVWLGTAARGNECYVQIYKDRTRKVRKTLRVTPLKDLNFPPEKYAAGIVALCYHRGHVWAAYGPVLLAINAANYSRVGILHVNGHQETIRSVISVGQELWTGADDKYIKVWNPDESGRCAASLEGHAGSVTRLVSNGVCVWSSGTRDCRIYLWDVAAKSFVKFVPLARSVPVAALAFDRHHNLLCAGDSSGSFCFWK